RRELPDEVDREAIGGKRAHDESPPVAASRVESLVEQLELGGQLGDRRAGGMPPAPRRAARESAAGLAPPSPTGTCGFWTGLGVIAQSLTRNSRPAKAGFFSVQSAFISARYSSMRRPRSSNEEPSSRNSSAIHPTPTPKITRPPDSWSAVAICLAVMIGWRIGRTVTLGPLWSLDVRPGRCPSATSGSSQSRSGSYGNPPSREYG